jgi:hypothetical protein
MVVCDKLINKNLTVQQATIRNLTVNNLTVLDSEVIPVDPLTAGFCQFDVPAVFPTIQEAINAAEASGALTATVNVCGGVYTEDFLYRNWKPLIFIYADTQTSANC